jgi:hypothetical protein
VKVKGKIVPLHVMHVYGGGTVTASIILNFRDGDEWATLNLDRFTPGKALQYTMTRWLGGFQRPPGLFFRTVHHSYRERNHDFSALLPVT